MVAGMNAAPLPSLADRPGLTARLTALLTCLLPLALLLPTASTAAPACPPAIAMPSEAQAQSLAAQAPDRGLLYRLRRDGVDSYLYGTLHVGRMEWLFPGPRLREAMTQSRVLALELDLQDPATLQILSQPPRHAEALKLSEPLRKRMSAQARAACLPEQALASLHPILQLSTYTVLQARWDGLDPSFGQEQMLSAWARQQGRSVLALESAERQQQALIPARAGEARKALLKGLDQLERGQVRPVLRRLAQAWADGDLELLQNYERWCECIEDEQDRIELRRLNDERNPELAHGIEALHAKGQPVLAAVGALHLSGDQSLPRLLAARGFEVERLVPASDKR